MALRSRKGLIALMLVLLSGSCREFQNEFETAALRCAWAPDLLGQDRKLFQLTQESGSIPEPKQLSLMQARFVEPGKSPLMLKISPKACVAVPLRAGLLQVQAAEAGLHAAQRLSPPFDAGISALPLKKKVKFDLALRCPKDGLYSNGPLPNPLQLTAQGSLESLDVELRAKPEAGEANLLLLHKPYGQQDVTASTHILPVQLPAGTWRLTLALRNSMEEWDQATTLAGQECLLYVQKEAPRLQGLHGRTFLQRPTVLKKGERLGWYADSPIPYELRFCKEKRAADEDLLTSMPTCEARAQCQELRNFELIEQKRADEEGYFHYFVYAEDRAGNRTPTHCEEVSVSGSAPQLDVSWNNPAWNVPLSVMSHAALDIEAQVTASHPELADERLLENLECKVDFALGGQTTIAGHDVLCTAGSCKGQTLGDFRPCPAQIRYSLSRFWQNQKAQRMEMRLHVRTSAVSGQSELSVRTLWIYPERFAPEQMAETADAIFESRDQFIFLKQGTSILQWNESSSAWDRVNLPASTEITKLMVVQGKDLGLYAVWKSGTSYGAAMWKDKEWIPLPGHERLNRCNFGMAAHPVEGFWCQSFDDVLLWQQGGWHEVKMPASCSILGGSPFSPKVALALDGTIFVKCSDTRLYRNLPAQGWEALPMPPKVPRSLAVDADNRVWIRTDSLDPSTYEDSIMVLNGQTWDIIPTRPRDLDPRRTSNLYSPGEGRIYYDDAQWDEASQSWQRDSDLDFNFPELRTLHRWDSYGQKLFWTAHGLGIQNSRGMSYVPLSSFGVMPEELALPLFDSRGRLWFLSELKTGAPRALYRVEDRHWQIYGEEAGIKAGQPNASIPVLWFNAEQMPEFFFSHGGLMRGSRQGWIPARPETTHDGRVLAIMVRAPQGHYYGHDYRRLYFIDEEGEPELLRVFSGTIHIASEPDAQGRLWLHVGHSRELWILDGRELIPAHLPEAHPITASINWYLLHDRTLVIHDLDIFRWNEVTQSWDTSHQDKEGLPSGPHMMRQAGSEHLVVQLSAGSKLQLHDQKVGKVSTLPVPPVEADKGIYRHTARGLFFLSYEKGLYLLKGEAWETILTPQDLKKRPEVRRDVGFTGFSLDVWDRLWIYGSPFQLLRIDSF